MHCKRGSDDLTKERDAHAFAKKYMDDIPGFIKFIAESDFSVCEGYKESWIICKRYGIRDGRGFVCEAMTQREIAKQLKISRSYISRIEKKALEKLRRRFEQG